MKLIRIFSLTGMIVLLGGLSFAQTTASIVGTVTDPSGAGVPTCTLKVTNDLTGFTRTLPCQPDGSYVATLLPLGTYSMEVSAGGFAPYVRTGITLTVQQIAKVDIQLQVGAVNQAVTVNSAAPLVQTEQAAVSAAMDGTRMVELPLSGRSPATLLALIPGVTNVSAGTLPNSLTVDVTIAGGRQSSDSYLLDNANFNSIQKMDGNPLPPPDFLSEFRVMMNTYDASKGMSSSSVIQAVTKSGTNQLHGDLFEFHRDNDLTARTFFSATTPFLVQNQFGGTVGGPIRKNKDFFFFGYQGTRIAQTAIVNSAFPATAAELQGNFSSSKGGAPTNPSTGQPFTGGVIPAADWDSAAVKYLSVLPQPDVANGTYYYTEPNSNNGTMLTLKMDHRFSDNNLLSVRWWYNKGTGIANNGNLPFGFNSHEAFFENIGLTDIHTFSAHLMNLFTMAYDRKNDAEGNMNMPFNTPMAAGINIPNPKPPNDPSGVSVTSRFSISPATAGVPLRLSNDYDLTDTLTWIRGKSTWKFGMLYLPTRFGPDYAAFENGAFVFNGGTTGNALADFLIGRPYSLEFLREIDFFKNYFSEVYVNNDYRATSRLTLNLGLQYHYECPDYNPRGEMANFAPNFQSTLFANAPTGETFWGDKGFPWGGSYPDHRNFEPRVGLSWDIFGNGKTSLRTGFGVFTQPQTTGSLEFPDLNQPFLPTIFNYNVAHFNNPITNLLPGPVPNDPIATYNPVTKQAEFILPVAMWAQDIHRRSGYVESYSFSIQHELAQNFLLEASYIGNVGRKLIQIYQANPGVYGPGATTANIETRRLYDTGQISSVIMDQNGGNSAFNGLELAVKKRLSKSYMFEAGYTWSRTLDESSVDESGAANYQNPFNLHADYGLADFHRKHVFTISGIWDLPSLSQYPALVRDVFGKWEFSGLLEAESGLPFNVVSGKDNSLTGVGNDRPNLLGNPEMQGGRSHAQMVAEFFNTSVFQANATGHYGNAGRNILTGPKTIEPDLGLFKNIPMMGDKMTWQFRAEFFNAVNHTNLGNPVATFTSAAFGQIQTIVGNPRQIQFALKLLF